MAEFGGKRRQPLPKRPPPAAGFSPAARRRRRSERRVPVFRAGRRRFCSPLWRPADGCGAAFRETFLILLHREPLNFRNSNGCTFPGRCSTSAAKQSPPFIHHIPNSMIITIYRGRMDCRLPGEWDRKVGFGPRPHPLCRAELILVKSFLLLWIRRRGWVEGKWDSGESGRLPVRARSLLRSQRGICAQRSVGIQ